MSETIIKGTPNGWGEYAGELIRCGECEHWWEEGGLCKHPKTMDGNICCLECTADFYCGYAERKHDL